MAVIRQCGFATSVVVPYPFSAIGNGGHVTTPVRTGHGDCWNWGTDTIDITPDEDDFIVFGMDCFTNNSTRDVAFRGDGNTVTHLTLRFDATNDRWQVYRGTSAGTLLGSTPIWLHFDTQTKALEL